MTKKLKIKRCQLCESRADSLKALENIRPTKGLRGGAIFSTETGHRIYQFDGEHLETIHACLQSHDDLLAAVERNLEVFKQCQKQSESGDEDESWQMLIDENSAAIAKATGKESA